jgi:hypothetical protein
MTTAFTIPTIVTHLTSGELAAAYIESGDRDFVAAACDEILRRGGSINYHHPSKTTLIDLEGVIREFPNT